MMKSSAEKPKFVVVLGPDGSGKSTLLSAIRERRPAWLVVSPSPTDLYPHPSVPYMDWTLTTHPRHYILDHQPFTRTAFFIQTLAILYEYHIAPALAQGRCAVCDSYYFRFLAKERILNPRGVAPLEQFCVNLPFPDLILELNVPLRVAFSRKQSLTRFEYKCNPTSEDFLDFQSKVNHNVAALTSSIDRQLIDATAEKVDVATSALSALDAVF